jgi:glycosyltransferase involved in cell wall biosynthesis
MIAPGLTHITTVPESLGFFRGQIDYMKARGFTVRAITSPGPDLERFAAEFQIGIDAAPMARRITPVADLAAVRAIRGSLRRHRPAIVHAHTPKGGLLGLLAARSTATPVRIYHMRGLPFTSATGWTRTLLRQTERLSCRLAHQVLCVSESLRTVAIDENLCQPSRIKVLARGSGNGVDAAGRFDPDTIAPEARRDTRAGLGIGTDGVVVGFVGRIVGDKGLGELIEAWRSIRETHRDVHLLVIGPVEPRDPIRRETELALRTDPRVHVIGTTRDMPRWYAAMDVVALPTYREGFPNVLLEAGAMRLAVVATRVPGCVDAVDDGHTGILVPPRDAPALARALETYLSDPALRRRHGAAGRDRVLEHFRPEGIWQALYLEYARLLAEAGVALDGFPRAERRPAARRPARATPGGSRRCESVPGAGGPAA